MMEKGLQGFMSMNHKDKSQGLTEVYEFFTRYVRRIRPDTHWKRTMKSNVNKVFFQLVTPSDIAFVISLLKNGMPVWDRKKVLFESEELRKTKVKPLFTTGEGQKRSFGKTTWSREGLKYFQKVERTWQETYGNKEEMLALINGWERWKPEGDLKKGKEIISTNWRKAERNKNGNGRREGDDDENNDGLDDDDGYHSDKYNDVEELPFRLDDENLTKDTGDEYEMDDDEYNDEDDSAGEKGYDEENATNVMEVRTSRRGSCKR
jgi:hypothetical protein